MLSLEQSSIENLNDIDHIPYQTITIVFGLVFVMHPFHI